MIISLVQSASGGTSIINKVKNPMNIAKALLFLNRNQYMNITSGGFTSELTVGAVFAGHEK